MPDIYLVRHEGNPFAGGLSTVRGNNCPKILKKGELSMTADHIHNIVRGVCLQAGSILLAWHKKREYYFLPGGHIEPGESASAALKRECDEEMGLAVTSGDFLCLFEHSWQNGDVIQHEMTSIFAMTCGEGRHPLSRVPHLEFRWVPIAQIPTLRFLPSQLSGIIVAVATGKQISAFISTMH